MPGDVRFQSTSRFFSATRGTKGNAESSTTGRTVPRPGAAAGRRSLSRPEAPVAQAAEGQQDYRAQAFDRRELIDRAESLDDEMLDHRALAVLLALLDTRKPMQSVKAEGKVDRKQKLPIPEWSHGDLLRDPRQTPREGKGELAHGEPVGEHAAGERGEAG